MAIDYGTDVSTVGGFDTTFRLQGGRQVVAWALARRLGTPRGGLLRDPLYGFDVRDFVQAKMTSAGRAALAAGVRAECLKDERVKSVRVAIEPASDGQTIRLVLEIGLASGPFRLVLSVSSVTVDILEAQ